jgi:alpha-1,2-mannosyltransferase
LLTALPAPARRVLLGAATCVVPLMVGLFVAATTFPGGTIRPWRPVMVDLDVYLQAGRVLLRGGDFYALDGPLQFLYPPFAALLAVPLVFVPLSLAQIAWTVAGVLMILAILHRLGLSGWRLSLTAAATAAVIEPVTQTLAFGQLGIVLVALVMLDLAPGPRALPGWRLLPEGVLTAVAAAIKLTPAIFIVYLFVVGKRRAAWTATVTAAGLTLGSAVVLPSASWQFWSRLAGGETGLGHSLIYYTNQSVFADVVRALRLASFATPVALLLCALVAALGVWAAALWHRLGEVRLALTLCGVAGLLASPVSWLHHFVWIVPLGACLALLDRQRLRAAPTWFVVLGWLLVGWVVISPYRILPHSGDVELRWDAFEHVLASVTAGLGLTFLIASAVLAWGALKPEVQRPRIEVYAVTPGSRGS